MANLKSWEEASQSPAYMDASPEQQAQMRKQYRAAGGTIPEPQAPEETGVLGNISQGVSNAVQSGGANLAHSAARGIGGLVELGENLTGVQTSYGKRIQDNARQVYDKRMAGIEDGIGKTAGEYAGIVGDIGLTVANPLAAAGLIAARETGRAYADQTPAEGEDKSALNAALVGGANYAAQRILPGLTGTAETTLGRIAQSAGANAVAGAKGGAVVGAAEALNKHGDDTNLANLIEGTAEGAGTGALYGGAIGGVHGAISRPSPQVFDKTPENVKTNISAEDEAVRAAQNADELRDAYSKAEDGNAASALNLLDENDFRLTDAVSLDSPSAQRILNTDQTRAEKAASIQAERSNVPGLNPFANPTRAQGKSFADNDHNQKQAVSMKDAMTDYTKDNTNTLNGVLDNLDRELTALRAEGDVTGTATDVKNRTQADRDFVDAYKQFYNEANTFKARDGEDFKNFVDKATALQKLSDNVSPEMKEAIGGLKKLKGMPEGFNPIKDAYTLNDAAKFMSSQDSGWRTHTSDGFKESSSPSFVMNTLGAAKYAINRFRSERARTSRQEQQDRNSEAIRSLAKSDAAVARSQREADIARAKMQETPPEDDIKFKTQADEVVEPTPPVAPEAVPERTPMRPDAVETPLQRLRREEAEKQAEAERQVREADVAPEPRGLTADELAGAGRSIAAARRAQTHEPVVETPPVEQPSPATVTPENIPSEPVMTARDLVAQRRRVRDEEARRKAEREEAEKLDKDSENLTKAEDEMLTQFEDAVSSRELVAQRRAVKEQADRMEAERLEKEAADKAAEAPETAPVEPEAKAEPLPTRAPKTAEKAPEPVKPQSGIEKLAAMSSTARQVTKDRMERFARSLYSPAAKAKATAENILAYKGDPKELMRRIRREDQATNAERHEEMARNQLASQQGIAAAKSVRVRDAFSEWVNERGLPADIASKTLRAEEKGLDGNVTSLDALKSRAEKMYRKQRQAELDKAYEEALAEEKVRNPEDKGPDLKAQKAGMMEEIDTLLKAEPLHPSQKAAIKAKMEDLVNNKFKSSEKAGREEGLEVGQMKDIWETFSNTFNREAELFNKANKNSQYEATAKHLEARRERLEALKAKAEARAKAKEQVETDRKTLESIAAQKNEIEQMFKGLPEEVRKSQEARTLKQLAAHHDKNSPVPPEKFRSYIERIHNAESDFLDRTRRLSEAEEDARTAKWNRMYEQAEEMNRKFDVGVKNAKEAELEKAQRIENDLAAVNRQRDDIRSRLSRALEERGITKEDADGFIGSYMDNRYSLLEAPMTPVDYQNARSKIEGDVNRFAKKFENLTPIEKEIVKATGDSELKAEVLGKDTVKAIEEARKVDAEVNKLKEEEEVMEKIRAALPEDERAQANADIKESIKEQEDAFADKVEKAFDANKDLKELASIAEVLDRVHGADKAGNNRRFVRALSQAADNKREYGDNPVAWFSADDYSAIAKLGASSAGGNKSRALQKIFGSTAEQAKGKLLGKDDVAKIRRVIKANPDMQIPSYKTSNRQDYMKFLEKFNDDGTSKIKRGSLSDKLQTQRRQSQVRLRVRSKD